MPPLPPLSADDLRARYPVLRQSLLARHDQCPLMNRFSLEGHPVTSKEAARGIIFHRYMQRYLNTLREVAERRMPSQEAMEILYEAEAQHDLDDMEQETHVHVPMDERTVLRIAALKMCQHDLSTERILAVEKRLFATIVYRDDTGRLVEREVSAKPDLIIAAPPDGLIIPDWKTTRSPPPRAAQPTTDRRDQQDPLSPEGYFQQRFYGFIGMRNFPNVNWVGLREFYPLAGEARMATIQRHELEHVEREIGLTVLELDRALMSGSEGAWEPQPGRHCRYCPRPMDCPIDPDDRFPPGLWDRDTAQRMAEAYQVVDRKRTWLTEGLRMAFEEHGPLPVESDKGDYAMGWRVSEEGERSFGLHPVATIADVLDGEDRECAKCGRIGRRGFKVDGIKSDPDRIVCSDTKACKARREAA